MEDKIEKSFRDLISTLQTARLYPLWHPQFKKAVDKAFASLQDVLKEREELVMGIIGEELAFEKEIYFNLSKMTKPVILYLKERGIERVAFSRGFENEELSKFVSFLIAPKQETKLQPQEALSLLGVRNITVGKIKVSSPSVSLEDKAKKSIDYLNVYKYSLDKVTDSMDKVLDGSQFDPLALRLSVSDIMENLLGRHQDFLNLATMKRYDARTFSHILNVSILAMYFSSKIGFIKQEVLDIGVAALFHDIGKLHISRKIIQKPQKLLEEESSVMKSHVIIGAEILLKYSPSLGVLPAVVSFEHHLKYNLSGYPKLSFPMPAHTISLLVSICDVYDALSQRRGYKGDYSPEMIYGLMIRGKGETFEPGLLERFFKIMGVWPVGSIVSLSDASIAVVREENEDDIFSPKVEVIAPPEKKGPVDLKSVKGQLKIERSLNILKEGKEYLALVNTQESSPPLSTS